MVSLDHRILLYNLHWLGCFDCGEQCERTHATLVFHLKSF